MLLTVKNLGPIQEGTIDLSKKFYVFVGYNNSGKTYMAHLLWTIYNEKIREKFVDYAIDRHLFEEYLPLKDVIEEVEDRLNSNNREEIEDVNIQDMFTIDLNLIQKFLKEFADFVKNEFPGILNIETTHCVVKEFFLCLDFDENVDLRHLEDVEGTLGTFTIRGNGSIDIKYFKSKGTLVIEIRKNGHIMINSFLNEFREYRGIRNSEKRLLIKIILNLLLDNFDPFYLPANRLFYPNFFDYVFGYEKEQKDKIINQLRQGQAREDVIQSFKSKYTEPVNNLLKEIYDLNRGYTVFSPRTQQYKDILEKLQSVIGGEIVVRPRKIEGISPLIEFFLKIDPEKELEMYLSSSSVNQLACLYLFLQYWVQDDNFLIIDEPEENLHPKNQIVLLELLVEFAHRDKNKVLLTTHSPLLMQAFNNYLYLGMLKTQGVNITHVIETENLAISPEAALSDDEVGIYFFNGTHIISYDVEEYGVMFSDFRSQSQKIERIAEVLTNRLYELNEDKEQHDDAIDGNQEKASA